MKCSGLGLFFVLIVNGLLGVSQADSGGLISLSEILASPQDFHQRIVTVRGVVTRPELHVDESGLFIDFVFELQENTRRLVVFGRHDRTRGDIQIVTGRQVEVVGMFWHERIAHGYALENNLEAFTVRFYPSLTPDRT